MTKRAYIRDFKYTLDFKEVKGGLNGFARVAGIYCVYAGTYDADNKKWSVRKLLYIGQSDDVRNRIVGETRHGELYIKHNYKKCWYRQLIDGEDFLFTVAEFGLYDQRMHAEAALIFRFRPVCNSEDVSRRNPRFTGFHFRSTSTYVTMRGDWYSTAEGMKRRDQPIGIPAGGRVF